VKDIVLHSEGDIGHAQRRVAYTFADMWKTITIEQTITIRMIPRFRVLAHSGQTQGMKAVLKECTKQNDSSCSSMYFVAFVLCPFEGDLLCRWVRRQQMGLC